MTNKTPDKEKVTRKTVNNKTKQLRAYLYALLVGFAYNHLNID